MPRGVNEHRAENLFGQVPMVRCCGPTDVARSKELGNQGPWVFQDVFIGRETQGNWSIKTAPDPLQPVPPLPPSERFRGIVSGNPQYLGGVLDTDQITGCPQDGRQLFSWFGFGEAVHWVHVRALKAGTIED